MRVLAVGERMSAACMEHIGKIAEEKDCRLEIVSRGVDDWRRAEGPFDAVVMVPPSDALMTRESVSRWGDALIADIRKAVPKALVLCRQPFSWNTGDITAYDTMSLNCMYFTLRHGIGTMPAGFAWQCYLQESEAPAVPADFLDACVWVEKLCEKNVRVLAYRPKEGLDSYDLEMARRSAVEAVRIFSPVPVRNCALEAIGRMTPMPVEADWWKRRLAEKKKEIAALNGEVDLVFIGSSQIHIWETRCPRQLRDIQRDFTLLNLGYSGDSFQKVCWRLTKGGELDGYRAKCIMLVQGGNNTRETPSAIALGMKQILDVLAVKQPQAKVLLMPVNPRREWDCGTAPRPRPDADRANEMLRHYADGRRVIWVDFREELYDDNDDTAWCMPGDRLHLGQEGLKIWYSHVSPLFYEICGRRLPPATEGWIDRVADRCRYKENRRCVWAARLEKRGGFVFEKIGGAEGKVEFAGGRIMIHKTNSRGALILKAHPFASHTNVNVRIYADVEVESSEHARSEGYLAADGFGPSETERELSARPDGCRERRYFHVTSRDGDIRPSIVVAGAPSKTYWSNWRAEDLIDPRLDGRRGAVASKPAPEPLKADAKIGEVVVVTGELSGNAARQLRILEAASLICSRCRIEEVIENPALLGRSRLVVFLGVGRLGASAAKLVKSLSSPARTLVYLEGSEAEGGLLEAAGFAVRTLARPPAPDVTSESVRWPDLETGVYGLKASPLATVEKREDVISFAHYGDEKSEVCVALRRDAKGCRHICVLAPCGLTPEYFNRLARESGAEVPTDETGLRAVMSGGILELECYRTGRYDIRLPGMARAVNLKSARPETVEDGVMKLNLTAGGVFRFEISGVIRKGE